MYEALYRLSRRPFATTPDPACYVPNEVADAALAQLGRCAREGTGIGVLTAAAGLGKTLLCQKLAAELDDEFAVVFLPNANYPTRRSLLQAILYELGHPYTRMGEQELRLELTTAVRGLPGDADALVLIVDEAHLLSDRLLEEIRTLTHLSADGEPLARAVLCGDITLEEKLSHPALQALNQRVACQVALEPLSLEDSRAYLAERLAWAGAKLESVFAPEAVRAICRASDGVPRCLNQLGDHSLLLGYLVEEKPIGPGTVLEALEDLKQLPLHWNDPGPVLTPVEQIRRDGSDSGVRGQESGVRGQGAGVGTAVERIRRDAASNMPADESIESAAIEPVETSVEIGASVEVGAVEVGAVEVGAVEVGAVEVGAAIEVGAEPVRVGADCLADSPFAMRAARIPRIHETRAWLLPEVIAAVAVCNPRSNRKTPAVDVLPQFDPSSWAETERVCRAVYSPEWNFVAEAVPDSAMTETVGSPEVELRAEDCGLPQPEPSPFAPQPWPVEWIDEFEDTIIPFEPCGGEWSSSIADEAELPTDVWTISEEPTEDAAHVVQPDPRRLLDGVMPLLDELIATVPFDTESIDPSSTLDQSAQRIDADGDADRTANVQSSPAADAADDEDVWATDPCAHADPDRLATADLETQIGVLVLDTSLATQRELYGRVRNRAADRALAEALQEALQVRPPAASPAQPASSLEPREPARQPTGEPYDVVEPADRPSAVADAPSSAVTTTPEQRRYGRLFSMLRRRARGED